MRKKTILIWSIALTVISIIFTIATYYGYIRYVQLRIGSPQSYIEKYKNLPRANDQRTVISFTTTPDKLDKIKPFISSILDQTVRVDQILFPCTETYQLPQYLKDVVTICPAGKDYGDATKFIPVLLKEKDSRTCIITLKDNVVYGKNYIELLTTEASKYPKSVVTDQNMYGLLIRPECYDCGIIDKENSVFDETWFLQNAKDVKVITCDENHKY